ncbi:hypothetical protein Btru_050377 [Bulinus truncatus]|nr:hypothetical protein Btru_050377 [Bulinus truncatus]
MIIKFRENHIQSMQQASKGFLEIEKDTLVQSLIEEIKVLKEQLESNPLLAKYAGENKHLRSELKQLRASESHSDVSRSDVSRSAHLERVFKELKLDKELSTGSPCGGLRASPLKDELSAAALEKHRREIKGYQEQVENLQQQLQNVTKASDNRLMEMEVESVSLRRMIVTTTPKRSSTQDQAVGDIPETELCILPKDLAEAAHEALMDEIHMLQMENGQLKEKSDEYEGAMLKQKQQAEKLELQISQLNIVLDKERAENTASRKNSESAVNTLKEEMATLKNDLKLLNDQNTELQHLLNHADKKLIEKNKSLQTLHHGYKQEIQVLNDKLSKSCLQLEATTRDYEDALKRLGSLKEEFETNLEATLFFEDHVIELEELTNREVRKREHLENELRALASKSAGDAICKEKSEGSLDLRLAELDATLALEEQDKTIQQQEKLIEENKYNINLDAEEAKKDLEKTSAQLMATLQNLTELKQSYETALHKKDFQIANLQEDQDSANCTMLRQAELLNGLQEQLQAKEVVCKEKLSMIDELKNKLEEKEKVLQETMQRFKDRLREVNNSDENADGLKKLLNQKNVELETMLQEYEHMRKEKNEENENLKLQLVELKRTKESLLKRMQEVEDLNLTLSTVGANEKCLVESLESSLKEKNQEIKREQSRNRELDGKIKSLLMEKETIKAQFNAAKREQNINSEEIGRLQRILDIYYTEKSDLSSKIESLLEENIKLKNCRQAPATYLMLNHSVDSVGVQTYSDVLDNSQQAGLSVNPTDPWAQTSLMSRSASESCLGSVPKPRRRGSVSMENLTHRSSGEDDYESDDEGQASASELQGHADAS